MSTQTKIEAHHVEYAIDGIQSALGYLPKNCAKGRPDVEAAIACLQAALEATCLIECDDEAEE